MKANRKFKTDNSGATYMAVVGGLVALMLMIVIGVMIYFEVTDSVDQFDAVTERFTGYTRWDGAAAGSNKTGVSIVLGNSPNSAADTNVTCWNESGTVEVESYPTVNLNHKTITIAADGASNFTRVNITYTSHAAATEAREVTPMAQTVFTLLPIIALVVVAAIIIGIILLFGGGKRGKL